MRELPDIIVWSIPAFLLLVLVEVGSFRLHGKSGTNGELGYGGKDTATSLSMGLGSVLLDGLWKVPAVATYSAVYAVTPLRVPDGWLYGLPVAVVAWPGLLVLQDFCYYWSHRCHHVVRILWASHVVHRSSRRFNLSTALRQPWTGFTSFVFYLPVIAPAQGPPGVVLR